MSKNSIGNTNRVSNSLDPDQAQQSVGPDLGPNCLQILSADNKSQRGKSFLVVLMCITLLFICEVLASLSAIGLTSLFVSIHKTTHSK